MQCGHLDDEGKQVVDDGIQKLVGHLAPGQVRHALQLVVQVQLQHADMTLKQVAVWQLWCKVGTRQ